MSFRALLPPQSALLGRLTGIPVSSLAGCSPNKESELLFPTAGGACCSRHGLCRDTEELPPFSLRPANRLLPSSTLPYLPFEVCPTCGPEGGPMHPRGAMNMVQYICGGHVTGSKTGYPHIYRAPFHLGLTKILTACSLLRLLGKPGLVWFLSLSPPYS